MGAVGRFGLVPHKDPVLSLSQGEDLYDCLTKGWGFLSHSYLQDHPRTCKWLVTTIFKPRMAIWKGSHNPILGKLANHGYLMILQVSKLSTVHPRWDVQPSAPRAWHWHENWMASDGRSLQPKWNMLRCTMFPGLIWLVLNPDPVGPHLLII